MTMMMMNQITDAASAVAYALNVQAALHVMTTLQITEFLWLPENKVPDNSVYDCIVVGAGTSGAVVAKRLAENQTLRVLLIEAGGDPPLESFLPRLVQFTRHSRLDYNFTSPDDGYSQQCHQDQKYIYQAGKVLGGKSSVNLMIYERGNERDYDNWVEAANNDRWAYRNILEDFKKTEQLKDDEILNSPNGVFHGVNGPIVVTRENRSEVNPFLNAFRELGNNIVLDLNGNVTLGYTKTQYTIDAERHSSAFGFLRINQGSPFLDLLKHTEVTKILFDENNNAIGVRAVTKDKKVVTFRARREVIISAGVINTPKLLMLSGIGPKKHLECNNIEVKSDLPVGENYQDHIGVMVLHKLKRVFVRPSIPDIRKFPIPSITGYVALNESSQYPDYVATGYVMSEEMAAERVLLDCAFSQRYKHCLCNKIYNETKGHKLFYTFIKNTIPKSRGRVLLRSSNYEDIPIIEGGLYSNDTDLEDHVKYLQHYIRISDTQIFRKMGAEMVDPTEKKCGMFEAGSIEYWKCYILCMMNPSRHSVGTCAMGSVVDSRLRVLGVQRLRVVDYSAIPVITTGNTYAPGIMIGEKGASLILEDL